MFNRADPSHAPHQLHCSMLTRRVWVYSRCQKSSLTNIRKRLLFLPFGCWCALLICLIWTNIPLDYIITWSHITNLTWHNYSAFSIAGLFDKCFYASSDRGWLLGINAVSEQGNRDPRFFFSLKTDRAHKVTSVYSNARYTPGQWAHVAVTYNGLYMKLYVNGAQTAVSREQSGDVFSPLTKKCKVSLILFTFNNLPRGKSWDLRSRFFVLRNQLVSQKITKKNRHKWN